MVILILAWSLSAVCEQVHTADYLVSILGDKVPGAIVPAAVFILAAAVAFATGTSWGTMGILIPLVVPLAYAVLKAGSPEGAVDVMAGGHHIMYSTVACVLAGAVWGDHCSPISDTTVLSSMASGCDHIDHVRTQLPYALVIGAIAVVMGTLPVGFGLPWWAGMILAVGAVIAVHWSVAKPVSDAP
jgi:Na+/H+ antiporter NhaC